MSHIPIGPSSRSRIQAQAPAPTAKAKAANLATKALHLVALALVLISTQNTGLSLGRPQTPTMAVRDVRPGMKGFGLTVFRGTRPERFDVEVIDVLHKFRPGQDLILIRTPHPRLNETLAVAGMSGSPIYLEGKLAGAYAYGWPFGTEPVVGVTPIADMLSELARPIDPEIWRILGPSPRRVAHRPKVAHTAAAAGAHHVELRRSGLPNFNSGDRRDASWGLTALRQLRAATVNPLPSAIEPALTPLMLGAVSQTAANWLGQHVRALGLEPFQAGGAAGLDPATSTRSQATYMDGSAVGVQLIRGDMSATAVGTVTHVQGRRLVAFGHPMMNMGQTALPTATAEVVHILASQQKSFKMSRPVQSLGTMVQDRQAAIVVDADLQPQTIPVDLVVRQDIDGSGDGKAVLRRAHFEVASSRALTPSLVFTGLLSSLRATSANDGDLVFEAHSRLDISGQPPLEFTERGHMPLGLASAMALSQLRVFSAIEATYGNEFERANIERLTLNVSVRYSDDVAIIEDVRVPFAEVRPGATVPVHVVLRSYNGKRTTKQMQVHIPASAAGKKLTIEVASGSRVKPELPRARNLGDVLEGLKVAYPATSLVLSSLLPAQGLRMRGHVLPQLPGSVFSSLKTGSHSDKNPVFSQQDRSVVQLGQVVYGSAQIQLDVREEAQ